MHTFSQLERLASHGGYELAGREISRVTVADIHRLYGALARMDGGEAHAAMLEVANLRRWIIHGDGMVPPVRGAGYVHANGEIWMAYTTHESPAVLRGRPAAFAEFRRCMAMATNPDYRGQLHVKTKPGIDVNTEGDRITLSSKEGEVAFDMQAAIDVEHWISITLKSRDRRGVLCLPGPWQPR